MIIRPSFCSKIQTKEHRFIIRIQLFETKKKKIITFFVNRDIKKNHSRKRAKNSADNRKSHDPIETLGKEIHPGIHGLTTAVAIVVAHEASVIWNVMIVIHT